MSRRGAPLLYITVDHEHGLALVSGDEARRVTRLLSPTPPRYSPGGRGWVVDAAVVHDIVAYAQHVHEFVVIGNRKPERGAAA